MTHVCRQQVEAVPPGQLLLQVPEGCVPLQVELLNAQQVFGAAALPAPGQLDGARSLVQATAAAQALACNVAPAGHKSPCWHEQTVARWWWQTQEGRTSCAGASAFRAVWLLQAALPTVGSFVPGQRWLAAHAYAHNETSRRYRMKGLKCGQDCVKGRPAGNSSIWQTAATMSPWATWCLQDGSW